MSKMKKELKNDPLMPMRHSCEHVLHQAMVELYPGLKRAMGPATAEGFYHDFDYDGKISEEDFSKIEERMTEIIRRDLPFIKEEISVNEAKKLFSDNEYKLDWINDIKDRGEKLTIYWTGKPHEKGSNVDLCAGPHVSSTGKIGPFKLLSIAGAYWHGNEKNKMLTRIYGTCFEKKEDLDKYLKQLEEAKKRDHRKLGQELDLFSFADEVGPGLVLWSPKGAIIREELEKLAKETEKKLGYQRVATPHIAKHTLFEISGHLPYYKDDMYSPMMIEGEEYYLKGMNCPHHHMIYKSKKRSYKELPLRYAEYGMVYRFEQSGALFGLMRVRSICQNDAHIYCTEEQAEEEFLKVLELHDFYYKLFGLTRDDYYIVMGLPDPKKKDKYHGDKALWDKAEKLMRGAISKSGMHSVDDIGGAAFYGPKIDINIRSVTGREFGASTNQLDLYMPGRFNLTYTDKDGSEKLCVAIHRAPLGSHERFIGFLIEHFAGAFPVWLSPVQVKIIPISENELSYARKIEANLDEAGLRAEVDDRSETMQAKIRDAQLQKVPYMFIIGKKESEAGTISIRLRTGENIPDVKEDEAIGRVLKMYKERSLDL
ncbi:threonine--tRNA ligase [candidate division WWE3 bacterium RIFCSPHIGHO2_01_FULL_40_23]|uniref:Threonine--tRNA ligase n=1 Tax=candidate division WWE3 bacterium RIFCSPLOWO2_01_FULL_41_18 TaxID=1802625 RepID=A0A1F4VEJ7_UNCKA|nr:MAG: threonine--tRNA ligase [candidate division WWE3 bacterium RIFCSPHIGHO2_01_FULL_40_23]OGC55584.1 MAG: threonine--tRNA ligase [candidate division WWE3 bacterium RIFCSPLOWO2_01_FULL_41_18]